MRCSSEQELLERLTALPKNYDAVVVEGYDGVGKGKVLNLLSEFYNVEPYRPDYNLWQKYDLRPQDRWKISGFFWDVFSHFNINTDKVLLFDRGVISGAVYNDDTSISETYKSLLRDKSVLHILVICNEVDYKKFAGIRGVGEESYQKCVDYTLKYIQNLELADADYMIYENIFDEEEASRLSETCAGCGHYSYGWCRHYIVNCRVDKNHLRCQYSLDKEVQDIDSEMQCV